MSSALLRFAGVVLLQPLGRLAQAFLGVAVGVEVFLAVAEQVAALAGLGVEQALGDLVEARARAIARSPSESSEEVASWYDTSLMTNIARAASAASGKATTLRRK